MSVRGQTPARLRAGGVPPVPRGLHCSFSPSPEGQPRAEPSSRLPIAPGHGVKGSASALPGAIQSLELGEGSSAASLNTPGGIGAGKGAALPSGCH